jgi:AcrR family transcriptional regulator
MRPEGIVWRVTGTHDVRRRLIDSTVELLSEGGLRAASPAAVADRAGASKMSLYRHFEGIDDLVAAALGEFDEGHRRRMIGDVAGAGAGSDQTAAARIRAMFLRSAERAEHPGFTGCVYVTTRLDASDAEHPAAEPAKRHKEAMLETLEALLQAAGDPDPQATAAVVLMLYDGALVHAVLLGSGEPLRQAAEALNRVAPTVFAAQPPVRGGL